MVIKPSGNVGKNRRRRGILTKKLFRDMRCSTMQFIAMMLLCFLGTWCFTGLDANWRMMDLSFETYFEQYNVADLWVRGSAFTREDVLRVGHLPDTETVIPRAAADGDCPNLGDDVTLHLLAYDGAMTICTPYLKDGELLKNGDNRGILLEEQFAKAHKLKVNDTIRLRVQNAELSFQIKGLVLSPEYIVTSKDVAPSPSTYGFALLNYGGLDFLPYTEMLVTMKDGAGIAALKAEISRLLPASLIQEIGTNGGTATARSFVQMFRSLSYLFPVLVYAIATMIVVSTLTRMIDNQRIQMGTLKALGFPERTIRNHYLSYALVPSLVGSLAGVYVGEYTLPDVIWLMVAHNARMPWKLRAPISVYSWIAFAGTVLLSVLVCWFVYRKAARECTADLLRPKPPKNGTRILLERWEGMWKRFSFNTKMVVRNIFRNKGRSFLSFVGVFTCNMLVVCSFCLQDSIPAFISNYYTGTHAYDVRVELKPGLAGTMESYQGRMDAELVEGIQEISISAIGPLQTRSCLLTVIPEGQQLLALGEGRTVMPMPENGVCVSRKMCQLLGLSLGDTLKLYITGDDDPILLPVNAYAETAIGQGVFISRNAWEQCRKGDFQATALLIKGPAQALLRELDAMEEVADLKYPADQNLQTLSIMDSTTATFSILTGAALLLAFIICYNMGLMNFTERTRDYATLKVLGYHQKEIRRLMMREQQAISLLAALLSIRPGMILTRIILSMCEYESMVFETTYLPLTIIKATALSILFAWAIEWLLTLKVKRIDMVEALKSVE